MKKYIGGKRKFVGTPKQQKDQELHSWVRSMVENLRQDPEYQAWAENVIRQSTAEQHFDEIRNGTFKPDTTRAEPRSVKLAEKLLKETKHG